MKPTMTMYQITAAYPNVAKLEEAIEQLREVTK